MFPCHEISCKNITTEIYETLHPEQKRVTSLTYFGLKEVNFLQ
jgi:hypothetical protein